VREFVDYARANPGKLNYASQGTTTVSFLTTEMFLAAAGIKVTHIPYKGTGPALAATMSGETEVFFDNLGASLAQVRAGRLKALAVCGERRHPALPDVPAMAEIYPGFVSVAWFGVLAPPRTPEAIVQKLSAGIAEALKAPEVQKRLADLSAEPIGMGPAQMAKYLAEEAARWREAIRFAGLKPE
jgi:tripartite-type tricarboxylate transporter receptor subunit TctC